MCSNDSASTNITLWFLYFILHTIYYYVLRWNEVCPSSSSRGESSPPISGGLAKEDCSIQVLQSIKRQKNRTRVGHILGRFASLSSCRPSPHLPSGNIATCTMVRQVSKSWNVSSLVMRRPTSPTDNLGFQSSRAKIEVKGESADDRMSVPRCLF